VRWIAPLLGEGGRAVWLLPTPARRRDAFERRRVRQTFAARTIDPDRAMHNLLERDRLFTDRLRRQTDALGLSAIEVGVRTTDTDLGSAGPTGPRPTGDRHLTPVGGVSQRQRRRGCWARLRGAVAGRRR
jgi:hypothetical protein